MAWDANPLPQTLGRQFFYVDEVDLSKSLIHSHFHDANEANMHPLLSPVREERRELTAAAPLAVVVSVTFHEPVTLPVYKRAYLSSQSFVPNDRICRGLLRRITHCTEEFITRKDSDALNHTQCLLKGPKPLRYEVTFTIQRKGHDEEWAERSFRSYQKHTLSVASVKQILRLTHNVVGIFMRRHDAAFEWVGEPFRDPCPGRPETFQPSLTGPPDLACIPRAFFVESAQEWEFVPGYSLQLAFTSSNPTRQRPEITRTLRIDSSQTAPLNLSFGEDLLWQAHRFVEDELDQKKHVFDLEHVNCDGFDGTLDCDCQHFDENALDVQVRVMNNLGPQYEHLHRSMQSRLRLFVDPEGQDCDEFVSRVSARFQQYRESTDEKVGRLHDFDLRIAELIGHGWREKNCARFTVDGRSRSRLTVQALLDRIRTGVSHVLRGHDVAIRMVAFKRGHLVLDKALIPRDHRSAPAPDALVMSRDQAEAFLERLKARIQQDMDVVLKNTCNLDDVDDGPSTPQRLVRRSRPSLISFGPSSPRYGARRFSHQSPPGSPANVGECLATPPKIPFRKSSRAFPLVPTRYSDRNEGESGTTISATPGSPRPLGSQGHETGCEVTRPRPADISRLPSAILEGPEDTPRDSGAQGLKPAAEVFPISRTSDYDTDSNSTHSSMPALTESDTASPDHSMLITPSCARSFSPTAHEEPCLGKAESYQIHPSWMETASDPSSIVSSENEPFDKLDEYRPATPSRTHSGNPHSVDTPIDTPSGDDKTPLAHRQMQGPRPTNVEIPPSVTAPHEIDAHDITSQKSSPCIGFDGPTSGTENQIIDDDNENAVQQNSHTDDEPLHFDFSHELLENESHDAKEDSDGTAAVVECDSSETLRPPPFMRQRPMESVTELRDDGGGLSNQQIQVPDVHVTDEPEDSEDSVPSASADEPASAMTEEELLSRSKFDFFELDDDEAPIGPDAEQNSGPVPGEVASQPTSFSDSGVGLGAQSEASKAALQPDGKRILAPLDEAAIDCSFDDEDSGSHSNDGSTELEHEAPFEESSSKGGRDVAAFGMIDSGNALAAAAKTLEESRPTFAVPTRTFTPDPIEDSEAEDLPESHLSVHPNPSAQLGLGKSQLLPPLPVLSSLAAPKATGDARASWSSSSSWEDYSSDGRQSRNSVSTIKPSRSPSVQDSDLDDEPGSPKRLGTPTAGLLGLHESCWADFGIRTALTGTHAYDRPSTAPLAGGSPEMDSAEPQLPEAAADGGKEKATKDQAKASPQRRTILLRQKKSVSSLIPGTKAHRLGKKESRELKKRQSQDLKSHRRTKSSPQAVSSDGDADAQDEESASRFPRAMMLAAGLAFASSFVSRNH